MNGLLKALNDYRDPLTLFPNPWPGVVEGGKHCDNGILFEATALILAQQKEEFEGFSTERECFTASLHKCELEPGLLARYPGETEPSSWDDHFGAAIACFLIQPMDPTTESDFAKRIYDYADLTDFGYRGLGLWRIPLFAPTLRVCANRGLNALDRIRVAACFMQNAFSKYGDTSGVCLLYLASLVHEDQSSLVDYAIKFWRKRMKAMYPGGMRQVYSVYFPPVEGRAHPFALFGPDHF